MSKCIFIFTSLSKSIFFHLSAHSLFCLEVVEGREMMEKCKQDQPACFKITVEETTQQGCMKIDKFKDGPLKITNEEFKKHLNKKTCLEKEQMIPAKVKLNWTDGVKQMKKVIAKYCFFNYNDDNDENDDKHDNEDTADSGSRSCIIGSTHLTAMLMVLLIIFEVI